MTNPSDLPQILYHYCPLSSFYAIVKSHVLRLTNVSFLNDSLEVQWFKNVCCEVFQQRQRQASQVGERESLQHLFEYLHGELADVGLDHIYCASFSSVADDLSQWRGYADDASGVCLGVDRNSIDALTQRSRYLELTPVEYDKTDQVAAAESLVNDAIGQLNEGGLKDQLIRGAFTYHSIRELAWRFKGSHFASEREIRLVARTSSSFSNRTMAEDYSLVAKQFGYEFAIQFEARRGRVVPFVEVRLPPGWLREVWLGPKFPSATAARAALQLFLSKNCLDAQIVRSAASYC